MGGGERGKNEEKMKKKIKVWTKEKKRGQERKGKEQKGGNERE